MRHLSHPVGSLTSSTVSRRPITMPVVSHLGTFTIHAVYLLLSADNPSYFSLAAEAAPVSHKKPHRMGTSDSECSLSRTSTPPKGQRRLRSFLRSVSSNSADSNQELLIMGEPRLSDIAPDLAFKHQSRSNSLKSRDGHGEVVYNLVPTEEEEDGEASGDEVRFFA